MIVDCDANNRLLIYFFYDRQGIVDDYVPYLLNEMDKYVRDMVIVSDGEIGKEGKDKLGLFTRHILEQKCFGVDIWAYQAAINYMGWEKLETYDEIILMGFTLMGPVYPLKEMFQIMSARDVDYWGLTKFYEVTYDSFSAISYCSYVPEHIPAHFLIVRKSLILSSAFREYWTNMEKDGDTPEKAGDYGMSFTWRMEERNFKQGVYIDTDEYRSLSYQPIINLGKQLIEEKRCPFFNRSIFTREYTSVLIESCGQEALELYRFLNEHTDYNMDLFWKNIVRTENQSDIKKALQLNFILPSNQKLWDKTQKELQNPKKIALIIHIYYTDLIEECFRYAQSMPVYADLYITTNTMEKKEAIEKIFRKRDWHKLDVRVTLNRGRDVAPFLVESRSYIMDYDYICHTHDKKVSQLKPGEIGASFSYRCFENVLRTPEFVENVLQTFEENPRIGLLTPPPPNHGPYYITLALEWGANYQPVRALAEKLGIHSAMADNREPVAPLGSVFWARTGALKKVFDYPWTYEDFPEEPAAEDGTIMHAVERIYNYSAQEEGFCPGWLFSESGASIEITNMYHMLRTLNQELFFNAQIAGSFHDILYKLHGKINQGVIDFKWNSTGKLTVYQRQKKEKPLGIFQETAERENGVLHWEFTGMKGLAGIEKLSFEFEEKGSLVFKNLRIQIERGSAQCESRTAADVTSSGIKIGDSLVFFSGCPIITCETKGDFEVTKVIIDASVEYEISSELEEVLKRKFSDKNFLYKIAAKVFHKKPAKV